MSSPGEMIRRRSSLNKSADFSAMRSSSQVSTIPFGSTVQARGVFLEKSCSAMLAQIH